MSNFTRLNKALFTLAAISFSTLTFAASTSIKFNQPGEITGDVFNQTSKEIFTEAPGFSPVIKPHAHSQQFNVSSPFTRVIYKDASGQHGCVFEFTWDENLKSMRIDDYDLNSDNSGGCHVVGGEKRVTLLVG